MTSPRVQRHRQAEAARRRVNSRGKRVSRPRQPARRTPARRPKYRKSAALGGLSGMFGALFVATGQISWAVGAVASSSGAAAAAYIDYRRDLIEAKRTGKPIGAKPSPRAGDPLRPGDPKPVDLDTHPQRGPIEAEWVAQQKRAQPRTPKTPAGKHGPPGHEATCKAKTPQACPYWRKANPGRAKTTKRAGGAGRKTK